MAILPVPTVPFLNRVTGRVDVAWENYLLSLNEIGSGAAPSDAQYYVATGNTDLTNERNLGALATGFLVITVGAGVAVPSSTLSGSALLSLNASQLSSGTVPDGRFPATLPAASGVNLTALTGANITGGGVYTPTLTNTTNLAASTALQCQYLRVGAMVTVSGKVEVDPTAAGSCVLGVSLPVASNLAAVEDCAGTAFAPGIAGQGAAVLGDIANDRATFQWIAVDVTNQAMYFSFSYRVL